MSSLKARTKRILGLTLATALVAAGTVSMATTSQANAAVKVSPSTGSATGGTIVAITGKDFQTAAGTSKVGTIFFTTAACAIGNIAQNPVVIKSVVSATRVVITTPALVQVPVTAKSTAYNLCMANAANTAVIGTAKFTSHPAPTINDATPATKGVSVLTGASYGGGTIVITGENFTTKTTAKIGNLPIIGAKVVLGSGTSITATGGDDTLTGTIPAGTGIDRDVSITSEGGTVKADPATQQFDYLDAIKVSPAFGNGTVGNVISITGSGFEARTFTNTPTANRAVIVLKPVSAPYTTATTIAQVLAAPCTNVQVVSDTELSCQAPNLSAATALGGYTVHIIDLNATVLTAQTAASVSANYTVAPF